MKQTHFVQFNRKSVVVARVGNPVGRCPRLLKTKINLMPSYGLYLRKMVPIPKNERKTPKKPFCDFCLYKELRKKGVALWRLFPNEFWLEIFYGVYWYPGATHEHCFLLIWLKKWFLTRPSAGVGCLCTPPCAILPILLKLWCIWL